MDYERIKIKKKILKFYQEKKNYQQNGSIYWNDVIEIYHSTFYTPSQCVFLMDVYEFAITGHNKEQFLHLIPRKNINVQEIVRLMDVYYTFPEKIKEIMYKKINFYFPGTIGLSFTKHTLLKDALTSKDFYLKEFTDPLDLIKLITNENDKIIANVIKDSKDDFYETILKNWNIGFIIFLAHENTVNYKRKPIEYYNARLHITAINSIKKFTTDLGNAPLSFVRENYQRAIEKYTIPKNVGISEKKNEHPLNISQNPTITTSFATPPATPFAMYPASLSNDFNTKKEIKWCALWESPYSIRLIADQYGCIVFDSPTKIPNYKDFSGYFANPPFFEKEYPKTVDYKSLDPMISINERLLFSTEFITYIKDNNLSDLNWINFISKKQIDPTTGNKKFIPSSGRLEILQPIIDAYEKNNNVKLIKFWELETNEITINTLMLFLETIKYNHEKLIKELFKPSNNNSEISFIKEFYEEHAAPPAFSH